MSVAQHQTSTTDLFAPLQPPTRYLFGPGPTMVDPRVYQALSKPIVGHLDPYFIQVMQDVQELLKTTYGTTQAPRWLFPEQVARAWKPRSPTL